MKSFIEFREWQEVKKLANRAATLMAELDIDVEDHISEFVESYDGELLKEGWWDNLKDKWKSSQLGGAVSAAAAAGKEQHSLPKFKFDKALAGLQALADAIPAKVRGVSGQKELKHWLTKIVSDLQKQKPAIDAVGVKPSEMGGFTAKDQAAHKAAQAPKGGAPTTTSTGSSTHFAGAGVTPDGKAIVNPALAGESTQVVENADAENTENENESALTKALNTEVEVENENTEKEYDPSKGSWYVDDDGNIVPNMPSDDDQNGFFGSW